VVGGLEGDENHYPETYAVAATSDGYGLAFGLQTFVEPSTRSGRRFAKAKEGVTVVGVELVHGDETLITASKKRRALLFPVEEISYLAGPGRGVILVKLGDEDALLGIKVARDGRDTLSVRTSMGGEQRINTEKYEVQSRGGKGREVVKRGELTEVIPELPAAPPPFEPGAPPSNGA
jgi:DNA gyrase subunit A